jgi:hypothetical protein
VAVEQPLVLVLEQQEQQIQVVVAVVETLLALLVAQVLFM